MTAEPIHRVVCPACGEVHILDLVFVDDASESETELVKGLTAIIARYDTQIARNRRVLRQIMYCWLIVGSASLVAAGGYYGGSDLITKWSAVTACLTTAVLAFTAAFWVVDLKIWSLKQ